MSYQLFVVEQVCAFQQRQALLLFSEQLCRELRCVVDEALVVFVADVCESCEVPDEEVQGFDLGE